MSGCVCVCRCNNNNKINNYNCKSYCHTIPLLMLYNFFVAFAQTHPTDICTHTPHIHSHVNTTNTIVQSITFVHNYLSNHLSTHLPLSCKKNLEIMLVKNDQWTFCSRISTHVGMPSLKIQIFMSSFCVHFAFISVCLKCFFFIFTTTRRF